MRFYAMAILLSVVLSACGDILEPERPTVFADTVVVLGDGWWEHREEGQYGLEPSEVDGSLPGYNYTGTVYLRGASQEDIENGLRRTMRIQGEWYEDETDTLHIGEHRLKASFAEPYVPEVGNPDVIEDYPRVSFHMELRHSGDQMPDASEIDTMIFKVELQ